MAPDQWRGPRAAPTPARPAVRAVAVLDTVDVDEARASLARAYCPHHVHLPGGGSGFRARHVQAVDGPLGVFRLGYGSGPVVVTPVPFRDFVLVSRPLAGHLEVRGASGAHTVGVHESVVLGPDTEHELHFSAGCRLLTVKLPCWSVARARAVALEDGPGAVLGTGPARDPDVWDAAVRFLLQEAVPHGLLAAGSPMRGPTLQLVAAAALAGFGAAPSPGVTPERPARQALRRALDFVDERAGDDIGLLDIAAAAGVSPRSLQHAFRRELDTTPLAHLRDTRLRRARRELRDDPDRTVADVAYACGFTHLGRFAADYRARFGRLPRDEHPRRPVRPTP